ncbi:hypothetical protein ACFU9X_41530 [Streptomyces atratus]|uniref:hypothetical protein n=1 Tax=Streptomyces atratus TaxID=1893 RepID=UPI00368436C8
MAAANRDLSKGQFSERSGQVDRHVPEADADCSVSLFDVVEGEAGDRCGPLGIEEQQ